MMMGCPRRSPSLGAMSRATTSVDPPGAYPIRTLMGFSGHAANAGNARAAANATTKRNIIPPGLDSRLRGNDVLLALEHGLAFLHERPAALGVILALEAIDDELAREIHVHIGAGLEHLADDALARLDGERRARGDRRGVFRKQGVQALGLGHAVDEADAKRFRGVEPARGEEDVLREPGPDEIGEVLHR